MLTSQKEQEQKAHRMSRAGVKLVVPGYLQARHSVYAVEKEFSIRYTTDTLNRSWNMQCYCMRM